MVDLPPTRDGQMSQTVPPCHPLNSDRVGPVSLISNCLFILYNELIARSAKLIESFGACQVSTAGYVT